MPISSWNTAQTLFWIITRQFPADPLLDDDSRSALVLALKDFVEDPLEAVQIAETQLEDELRQRNVLSTALHDLTIKIRSGTGADTPWGYYAQGASGSIRLHFPKASIEKRWPSAKSSGAKRGPKAKYDTIKFLARASELLKKKKGVNPRFTHAEFKAAMQEWALNEWGAEPGQTWIKKHLAIAIDQHEAAKRR